jgi:two-component system OmpR family response regulator
VAEARILVVDDEAYITDLVRMALRYEGFEVAAAATGRQALTEAARFEPDLVVLDLMLPDMEGLEVCRRLRAAQGPVPVVFLTAKDATEDKVAGLTVGGDDYVTKPFSLDEIVARILAILRRTMQADEESIIRAGELTMDQDTHDVWRQETPIQLTATEFKLLRYLVRNARRVVSKAQILDSVWHYDFGGNDNIVETYVSYLRRKVDRFQPPLIHTVRGAGYSLRLPSA